MTPVQALALLRERIEEARRNRGDLSFILGPPDEDRPRPWDALEETVKALENILTTMRDGVRVTGMALERGGNLANVGDIRTMFKLEAQDLEAALVRAASRLEGKP